jgi:probable F420-dependent oxidoreductase
VTTARERGTVALACYGLAAAETVPLARHVEEAGFDGIWLGEHVVTPVAPASQHPYPSSLHVVPIISEDVELVDQWVAFAAMAAVTSRIFLASGIHILPLRHPLLTARATATLQGIAAGRLIVGGAVGWLAEEFAALGQEFQGRGARTEEIVEILRLAWRGSAFGYEGAHYRFDPVVVTPRAVEIPLVLGGASEPALRRAARWADGWRNPSSWSLEQCVEVRTRLADLVVGEGRSPETFRFHISMLDTTRATLDEYRDAGFVHLSVPTFALWRRPEPVPLAQKLDDVDRLADELGLRAD